MNAIQQFMDWIQLPAIHGLDTIKSDDEVIKLNADSQANALAWRKVWKRETEKEI